MKAIIHGHAMPRNKKVEYETENLFIEIDLPFIPTKGTSLMVTPHGEYQIVDQVFWNCRNPDQIQVFIEEPEDDSEIRPFTEMLKEGWRVGSGPEFEEKNP